MGPVLPYHDSMYLPGIVRVRKATKLVLHSNQTNQKPMTINNQLHYIKDAKMVIIRRTTNLQPRKRNARL